MNTTQSNNRAFIATLLFIAIMATLVVENVSGISRLQDGSIPLSQPRKNQDMWSQFILRMQAADILQNSEAGLQLKSHQEKLSQVGYAKLIYTLLSQRKADNVEKDGIKDVEDFSEQIQNTFDLMEEVSYNANDTISSACANDTGRIIMGTLMREKWVIPFLDSAGKPGPSLSLLRFNFVGNYHQCRSAVSHGEGNRTFRGNYCSVGTALKTVGVPTAFTQWGLCVPSSCTIEDLYLMVDYALQETNFSSFLTPTIPDCHTDEREVTIATIAAIVLISIIGLLLLMGTAYDLLVIQLPKWIYYSTTDHKLVFKSPINLEASPRVSVEADQGTTEDQSDVAKLIPQASKRTSKLNDILSKVLLAFSVYTNGKKLLNTSTTPGSLGAIHGIRFLSMSWVLLGHSVMTIIAVSVNSAEAVPTLLHRWTFDVITNALPSVDTFFALSGLLTSYLTIKEMNKKSWKINWPLFYFHRFWRLTPPYMFCLLIVLGFQRFFGSGALWATVQPADKVNCEKNWWTNLLYINNIVKNDEGCFAHSWYLSNDMQFFVVSPLMLIPFYFHRLAGFVSCCIFLGITWITTGVLSVENKWGTSLTSPSVLSWFSDYYVKPWCRIGPFVVGVMAGYLLAVTDGGRRLRMKWWIAVWGWLVATASGLAVIYGIDGDISRRHMSSVGAAALYNAVARSVWGACVCWVIVACVSGYGGPVNALLSWSPFVFLGRLTYMSYLIHLSILAIIFSNGDFLYYLNDTNLIMFFLGLLVLVNMVAFVLTLALESPMLALERAFLRKERRD